MCNAVQNFKPGGTDLMAMAAADVLEPIEHAATGAITGYHII